MIWHWVPFITIPKLSPLPVLAPLLPPPPSLPPHITLSPTVPLLCRPPLLPPVPSLFHPLSLSVLPPIRMFPCPLSLYNSPVSIDLIHTHCPVETATLLTLIYLNLTQCTRIAADTLTHIRGHPIYTVSCVVGVTLRLQTVVYVDAAILANEACQVKKAI